MLTIQTFRRRLAGHGIVVARAGSNARAGRPVELSQDQHTDGIIDDRAVIQQQTPAIRTVQETAEVPRRHQLDRTVDVAVPMHPTYSKRSPSGKLGGAGRMRERLDGKTGSS